MKIYYPYVYDHMLLSVRVGGGGGGGQENLLQAGLRIYSHFHNGFLRKCIALSPSICIKGKI